MNEDERVTIVAEWKRWHPDHPKGIVLELQKGSQFTLRCWDLKSGDTDDVFYINPEEVHQLIAALRKGLRMWAER